MLLKFAEQN